MTLTDVSASLLDAYLEAYPGWLSDEEASLVAGMGAIWWADFTVLRDTKMIEEVPGQTVRLSTGNLQVPCRITDAGATALREWKEREWQPSRRN